MDETERLESAVTQIGQATRKELLQRFHSITEAENYLIRVALLHSRPVLAELIGENAKLKKQLAERSPGGHADAPVADDLAWTERDQTQHDIRMTDDPIYAKWYRKREKERDAMENGINED